MNPILSRFSFHWFHCSSTFILFVWRRGKLQWIEYVHWIEFPFFDLLFVVVNFYFCLCVLTLINYTISLNLHIRDERKWFKVCLKSEKIICISIAHTLSRRISLEVEIRLMSWRSTFLVRCYNKMNINF